MPEFTAILVALGEVGAGIAVIVGGFLGTTGHLITRLGGGAVVVIMIGAFAIAHPDWFITKDLFMSEQIFLFILGAYFAIKGNLYENDYHYHSQGVFPLDMLGGKDEP